MGTDLQGGEWTRRCLSVCSPAPVKSGVTSLCSQWPALEWLHSPFPLSCCHSWHTWKYPSSRTWMWTPHSTRGTFHKGSHETTKSPSCHWAQPGAQCSLCSSWYDNSCGSTPQPSWDLDTNPSSCTERYRLSVYSSSENKKTSWQDSFFNVFATCPLKKVRHHCIPGLGLGCDSVTSLLEEHSSSPSFLFCNAGIVPGVSYLRHVSPHSATTTGPHRRDCW